MIITKANPVEAYQDAVNCIQSKTNKNHYIVYEEKYLVAGNQEPPNLQKAEELGIQVFPIQTNGGSIIVSPGDIGIGLLTNGESCNTLIETLRKMLVAYLSEQGLNVSEDGNDVLVDGFKVASHGTLAFDGMFFAIMQISINVDLTAIQAICNKRMIKIPKGLSGYNITTQQILDNVIIPFANFN